MASLQLQSGTEIGKYVLESLIGQGGMGQVWKAHHKLMRRREVAIKFLLPEHQLLSDSVKRFLREAEILADLGTHPHIVQIFDIDQMDDRYYIVMEYVPDSLAKRLGEAEMQGGDTVGATVQNAQMLSMDEATRMGREICEALSFAHEKGVIHRDLKPANVLLAEDGSVRVCDFGIAHMAEGSRLTSVNAAMGTMGYTAPEVYQGGTQRADACADVYSIGAILYRMMTGQMPLGRFSDPSTLNSGISSELETAILSCLETLPDKRAVSVAQIINVLSNSKTTQTSVSPNATVSINTGRTSEDLHELWEAHEVRLKNMGFDVPGDQKLVIRNAKDDGIALWIPSGEFVMGSEEGRDSEKPVHRVVLDGFYMDIYPITVGQYQKYVKETGVEMPPEPSWGWQADHPIVRVSWEDAQAYCAWSGKVLPSEAQWEYGACGVDGRKYAWGNEALSSGLCNYDGNVGKATPVGSYASGISAFGLCDMSGNVWEWCADWYDENYYSNSPDKNPVNGKEGKYRSLRGGSWNNYSDLMRCAFRSRNSPDDRYFNFGIRCVRQK